MPICDLVLGFFDAYSDTLRQSGSGIPQYLWWYVVSIWLLASSVLMVVRCADLLPGFFNIYGSTLCQSSSWILDSGS